MRRSVSEIAVVLAFLSGCAGILGMDEVVALDDGALLPDGGKPLNEGGSSSGDVTNPNPLQDGQVADVALDTAPIKGPGRANYTYWREIRLRRNGPGVTDYPVLINLTSSFDYTHAGTNGDDLRFQDQALGADLPYYIESWNPGGTSMVWVRVPSIPNASHILHMFYGSTGAAAASDFATTFPISQRTTGDINAASVQADLDWFELSAGHVLTLGSSPLTITAHRIIINGTISGKGRGNAGSTGQANGSGPGGGQAAQDSSGGGGGYGGKGGKGFGATTDTGGQPYGTTNQDEIGVGSGGAGATNNGVGGAGGSAVMLRAWALRVSSEINVDGNDAPAAATHAGGGGSGGGIFLEAGYLDMGGAQLFARGGKGGNAPRAGGGGGGGRIKIRSREDGLHVAEQAISAALGAAGEGTNRGDPGVTGTVNDQFSAPINGVIATVAAEGPAN